MIRPPFPVKIFKLALAPAPSVYVILNSFLCEFRIHTQLNYHAKPFIIIFYPSHNGSNLSSTTKIFVGLAYSIAISTLYLEIFNVAVTSFAAHYMALMFSWNIPWIECDFDERSHDCVFLNYTKTWYKNHTKECCHVYRNPNCTAQVWNSNSLKFGAYDFYFNNVLRFGYDNEPMYDEYLSNLFVFVIISWCIIFFLSVIGLRRYAKIITGINLTIFASFVPISLFTFVISPNYTMIKSMKTNFTALRNYLVSNITQFDINLNIHFLI